MAYGSITGPGGALATTGLATGQMWLVVVSAALVTAGAMLVRVSFRRNLGPVSR